MDDFPSRGGVFETMIPDTIVLGKPIPDYNIKIIYILDPMLLYTLVQKLNENKKCTCYRLKGL